MLFNSTFRLYKLLDMVGFVHLHASMLIEAKTTYSHD